MQPPRSLRLSSSTRLAFSTVLVGSAFGLTGVVPAQADSTPAPTAPTAPAAPAVAAPAAPDVSQAVSAATAATQLGPQNVNVSIRIGSPGDNGPVTQTIAAVAAAAAAATVGSAVQNPAQTTGQTVPDAAAQATTGGPTTAQTGAAEATATQVAPANLDLSVRIASPGNDAAVTQANTVVATAAAAVQAQYQQPAGQYQPASAPQPDAAPTTPATQPAPAPVLVAPPSVQAPTQPVLSTPTPPVLPASWTWNWTWTCSDITDAGITTPIDTGVAGWIWNWNIGTMCATQAPPHESIPPVNLPSIDPPVIPSPESSPGPAVAPAGATAPPPPAAPAAAAAPVSQIDPAQIDPAAGPAADLQATPSEPDALIGAPLALSTVQGVVPLEPASSFVSALLVQTASADPPAPVAFAAVAASTAVRPASAERADGPRTQRRPQPARAPGLPTSLGLTFAPAAAGAAGGGGGGGGGGGLALALAILLFVQVPGIRGPRHALQRRRPHTRVDDKRGRPG